MAEPTDPTAPTMAQILEAIKNASTENVKAFKDALGVSEATSTSRDTSELDAKALDMLAKRAQLTSQISKMKDLEYKAEKTRVLEIAQLLKDNGDILEADRQAAEDMIAALESGQDLASTRFNVAELDEVLDKIAEMKDVEELRNAAVKEGRDVQAKSAAEGIAGMVGLKNYSNSAIGKVTDLFASMADGSEAAQGQARILGEQLAEAFSPQAIGLAVFNKVLKESMKVLNAFDQGLATLAGKTGTVGKFNDVLYDTQRAGNLLGVSMEGAANAIIALNAGTSQFAKLSKQTQTDLAISTSQMERLGVSASDTAEFMENAFKIMGMGATEAIETQTELAMAGVQLGIGADKIVKDFNAASKTLAVYGKGSVKVFKGLAAQAKAAGVEVSTLLGIVQKFDTFSGAAEGAAHFNALLGTQLSTTQMLMMTEDERMKTLIQQVQAQGVAFGDMDRFTQKSIAAAAGITDMNEANRIFSMSLADYEANSKELANNAEAQKKFDDAVQATVPTMKKFQNLATELIVMVQPALEKLGEIADYLTEAFQNMSKETKEALGTAAMAIAGILVVAPLFAVGGGFMAGLAAIGPAIAGIGAGVATAAAAISGIAMTGIGAAALGALALAGGGIAVAMVSMSKSKAKMAESNAKMVSEGSDTIKAMADIGNADFSGIATKFRGAMQELSRMGSDVKVTSTLQNLALIGSSTAFDMTGAKIAASSTNVTANVSNVFDGMKLTLEAGGQQFEAYIKDVAATTAMS
mgnify:CR=1 FL=1|tara:strand:+ start:682 stop:2937 length:2256 start_codon:yes stop_codon:yes gene_type:complete